MNMSIGVTFGIGRQIKQECFNCSGACLAIDQPHTYTVSFDHFHIIAGANQFSKLDTQSVSQTPKGLEARVTRSIFQC
ncbi:hypothetical protein [Brucella melitensis]|uniref:hypothetical protein n=1 Tax=Brucella melitensis TaxID=29459 RepID=UPI003F6893E2